ncbi:hypothetical protein GLOTRDRAFT_125036 [Gloeophyllum trabeum ATCC 11539]|uniref:HMG box domain-containing protein n=1 Tax=Gloeophyllum trabeum (strain ATCC 11539 / FP-39264 / Madison 617) TaxID=670483 RepID=S7S1I4_GLOTA|nr:uncharacterized protein GLOTRDRAFT_125036 [Gloeophyllum trabeum ATCC 11539]EPQ61315.1 hypothetical protein GLOTRDRAFT_125036 [Gloeophyllum trabeum ATCC 11539]
MQRALPNPAIPAPDQPSSEHIRRIRNDSFSGSEGSSGYSPYSTAKHELEVSEEDMHAALTSQSLNADGTPKRPMNAFMIFARKRRPEVSAANQTMRTGDISKILSREWNAMEMSDKQFYLDQAKKLKDNFNAKYPDYVYRRRPNNSRKKRRTDGGMNRLPDSASFDGGDDFLGAADWEDHSPVEGEDGLGYSPELQYSRGHSTGYPPTKEESNDFLPRAGPYGSYESPTGQYGAPQYTNPPVPNTHSYPSQVHIAGHSQSPPLYQDHGVGQSWTGSRVEGRAPGWSTTQSLSLSTQQEPSLSPLASSKDLYSPRSWSSSISSDSSSASSGVIPGHGQTSSFPTLNSPFYPQTPGLDEGTPHAGSPQYFPGPSSQEDSYLGRNTGSPYDGSSYARSSGTSYIPGQADTLGRSTLSRPLPSIHSMPAYSLHQNIHSMNAPAPTSGPSSNMGYWDRDRVGDS